MAWTTPSFLQSYYALPWLYLGVWHTKRICREVGFMVEISLWRSKKDDIFCLIFWIIFGVLICFWYKDDILLAGRFSGRLFHYEWIQSYSNSWLENWERCSTIVVHQQLLMGVNKQQAFPPKCQIDILCVLSFFQSSLWLILMYLNHWGWTFLNTRALHRIYFSTWYLM